METSFCELRAKEVVNVVDGKRLGRIIDLVFEDSCCKVLGFVVPGCKQGFNWFKPNENIFIPCQNICKIGADVILVELFINNSPHKRLNKSRVYSTTAEVENTIINTPEQ